MTPAISRGRGSPKNFQAEFLPKDTTAFGFAEPVTGDEGADHTGFLQVDRRSFVQIRNLLRSCVGQ